MIMIKKLNTNIGKYLVKHIITQSKQSQHPNGVLVFKQ